MLPCAAIWQSLSSLKLIKRAFTADSCSLFRCAFGLENSLGLSRAKAQLLRLGVFQVLERFARGFLLSFQVPACGHSRLEVSAGAILFVAIGGLGLNARHQGFLPRNQANRSESPRRGGLVAASIGESFPLVQVGLAGVRLNLGSVAAGARCLRSSHVVGLQCKTSLHLVVLADLDVCAW